MPGLVLALDQGGHGSRAVLFDQCGGELAASHVPVATRHDTDGRVEQDPRELVRSLARAAQDACDSHAAAGRTIGSVGLATQRSTIVCWERSSGRALTEAISWQDRRNAAWLERLRPQAAEIRRLTGLVLSPHYGASKLRWCLDHVPGVQRAAERGDLACGPLSSYLLNHLVEERPQVADPANASRTLLFDPSTLDWSPPLLHAFDIDRRCLPDCVPTGHAYGHLLVEARRIPLTVCTGDQSAAAFAFGRPDSEVALVNVGTGAFVQRAAPAGAPLPDGLLRSVLRSDGTGAVYSHEGTVNGAGSAIDWLRGCTALDVERALPGLAVRPGDDVPLFVNGVGGLGAPFWLPGFPVEFVGDADDSLRLAAVVESIAFLLRINLDAMRRAATLHGARISGGMAGCDYLCQALADLCGFAVQRHALREATARGVAFLAAGEPADWQAVPVERSLPAATERAARREIRPLDRGDGPARRGRAVARGGARPRFLPRGQRRVDLALDPGATAPRVVVAAVPAEPGAGDGERRRTGDAVEVRNRNDRVVRRRDDACRVVDAREHIARDCVASQVFLQGRVAAVATRKVLGHVGQAVHLLHFVEVVEPWPRRLLLPQRPVPLPHEIAPIERPAALEPHERVLGIDHRADGDDLLEFQSGRACARRDSQEEVPSQREPDEIETAPGIQLLDALHCAHDLHDAARMEDLGIEIVAAAVVTEIQPHDVEPVVQQVLAQRQDVEGLRASLPAVQQHREARGRGATQSFRGRVVREQPDALPAVEHSRPRDGRETPAVPRDARAPEWQARKDRLDVRVR